MGLKVFNQFKTIIALSIIAASAPGLGAELNPSFFVNQTHRKIVEDLSKTFPRAGSALDPVAPDGSGFVSEVAALRKVGSLAPKNRWSLYRIGADLVEINIPDSQWTHVGVLDVGFDDQANWLKDRTTAKHYAPTSNGPLAPTADHGTHVCGVISMIGDLAAENLSLPKLCLATDVGPKTYAKMLARHASDLQGLRKLNPNNPHDLEEIRTVINSIRADYYNNFYQESLSEQLVNLIADPKVKVVSASLVFGLNAGWGPTVKDLLKNSETLLINAAGNDGAELSEFGAKVPQEGTIFVAATNSLNNLAEFSNHGSAVFISAPGEDIKSFVSSDNKGRDPKEQDMMGTSMAAPHVSGVAALVWSIGPNLKRAEVLEILKRSAIDLGAKGFDKIYGHGLLNAYGATELTRAYTKTKDFDSAQNAIIEQAAIEYKKSIDCLQSDTKNAEASQSIEDCAKAARRAYFLDPKNRDYQEIVLITEFIAGGREHILSAALAIAPDSVNFDTYKLGFDAWLKNLEFESPNQQNRKLRQEVLKNFTSRLDSHLVDLPDEVLKNTLRFGLEMAHANLAFDSLPETQKKRIIRGNLISTQVELLYQFLLSLDDMNDRDLVSEFAQDHLFRQVHNRYAFANNGCRSPQSACKSLLDNGLKLSAKNPVHPRKGFVNFVIEIGIEVAKGDPSKANGVKLLNQLLDDLPEHQDLHTLQFRLQLAIKDLSNHGTASVKNEPKVATDKSIDEQVQDLVSTRPATSNEWADFFEQTPIRGISPKTELSDKTKAALLFAWSQTPTAERERFWKSFSASLSRGDDWRKTATRDTAITILTRIGATDATQLARNFLEKGSISEFRSAYDALLVGRQITKADIDGILKRESIANTDQVNLRIAHVGNTYTKLLKNKVISNADAFNIILKSLDQASLELAVKIAGVSSGRVQDGVDATDLRTRWTTKTFLNLWILYNQRDAIHELMVTDGQLPPEWLQLCVDETNREFSAAQPNPFKSAVTFELCSHIFQISLQLDPNVQPKNWAAFESWVSFANISSDRRRANLGELVKWVLKNQKYVSDGMSAAEKTDRRYLNFRLRPGHPNRIVSEDFALEPKVDGELLIRGAPMSATPRSLKTPRKVAVNSPSGQWDFSWIKTSMEDDSTVYVFMATDLLRSRHFSQPGPAESVHLNDQLFILKDQYSRHTLFLLTQDPNEMSRLIINAKGDAQLNSMMTLATEVFATIRLSKDESAFKTFSKAIESAYQSRFGEWRKAKPEEAFKAAVSMHKSALGDDQTLLEWTTWTEDQFVAGFAEAPGAPLTNSYFEHLSLGSPSLVAKLKALDTKSWTAEKRGQLQGIVHLIENRVPLTETFFRVPAR